MVISTDTMITIAGTGLVAVFVGIISMLFNGIRNAGVDAHKRINAMNDIVATKKSVENIEHKIDSLTSAIMQISIKHAEDYKEMRGEILTQMRIDCDLKIKAIKNG